MPETYDEFLDRTNPGLQRMPRANLAQVTAELAHLVQAQVSASTLTGDAHWDIYLQLLQGRIEALQHDYEIGRTALEDPGIVGAEAMTRWKIATIACKAQIDILEWAMTLPTRMREASSDAQETLKMLQSEDAA